MIRIIKKLLENDFKKFSFLFFIMFISSFLDMISVGLLIPLINTVLENSVEIPFISDFYLYLKSQFSFSNEEMIIFSLSLVFATFLFKNIFLVLYTKLNTNFLTFFGVKYQEILYQKYANLPYKELSKMRTAELLRNINVEARILSQDLLSPALTLLLNFTTLLLFITLLLFVNFNITISLFIIFIIIFLFFSQIFKKKINKFGFQRQKYTFKITEYIKQTFEGIRDLKINNKESFFTSRLKINLSRFASMGVSKSIIAILPRIFIEILMVFLFIFMFFLGIKLNYDYQSIVAILSIYALTAFRMLPNINSMIKCYQKMNYSESAFLLFEKILNKEDEKKYLNYSKKEIKKIDFSKSINIKNLSFSYDKKIIFENLNLNINRNSVIGIIGESGVGKSTLVDLLCGLINPNVGQVIVDEIDISSNPSSWTNNVGYVQQDFFIFDDSLKKNITLENDDEKINYELLKKCINLANLDELVKSFQNGLDENLGEFGLKLSGGQKQRVGIARALYRQPKLLIFDEPLNNLDDNAVNKILKIIYDLRDKKTIIIISHDERPLKNCDAIYKIENKNIKKIN